MNYYFDLGTYLVIIFFYLLNYYSDLSILKLYNFLKFSSSFRRNLFWFFSTHFFLQIVNIFISIKILFLMCLKISINNWKINQFYFFFVKEFCIGTIIVKFYCMLKRYKVEYSENLYSLVYFCRTFKNRWPWNLALIFSFNLSTTSYNLAVFVVFL